jgi:hypothetical protein
MELKEPFPGTYEFIGKTEPAELDIAAKIRMPGRTIEPWQFHYEPFKEKIIVEEGTLLVESITGDINCICALYHCKEPILGAYSKNESVKIGAYVPHRLINLHDEDLTFIVESSPGPEHRMDLEPEYSGFNECIEALRKALLANAKKV